MESADFALTQLAVEGHVKARNAQDMNLWVKFFSRPWHDQNASEEAGRPIFRDKDYIEIIAPADKGNIVIRPVTQIDEQRFKKQYADYKAGRDQETVVGTPLALLPGLSPSQIEEMKYFKVFTLEQLIAMPDSNAVGFMGARDMQDRARKFLAAANSSVTTRELDETKAELAALRQAVADMQTGEKADPTAKTDHTVTPTQRRKRVANGEETEG